MARETVRYAAYDGRLVSAGVDLINTNDLEGLQKFLLEHAP